MSTPLEHILDTVQEYKRNALDIAALTERQKTLRARIEDELGDDDTGTLLGVPVVTFKYGKRRTLDQRALKAAHPDLVEEFTTVTESRTFRMAN